MNQKTQKNSLGSKGGAVVRALVSHQCGPGSNPGVDAMRGLSLSLVLSRAPRGFSPGTTVFPLLNQYFQIPIRSGTHGHNSTSSYELLSAPWVNTLQFNTIIQFNDLAEAIEAAVTPEWIVIHTCFLQFDWSGDHNVTLTCLPMTNHEQLLVTAGW